VTIDTSPPAVLAPPPAQADEKGGYVVIHTPLTMARGLLLALVVFGLLGVIVLGTIAGAPQQ